MPSKDAKIAELEETIERQALTIKRLEERLCELELELARAKKDSSTSSKPPSSDIVNPPKPKKKRGRPKKRRKGGQPGHERRLREPLPPERVDETIEYSLDDAEVARHGLTLTGDFEIVQHIELPDTPKDYFRFMFSDGVEPTNNHSEQQIRQCVIDRRITQGTRGEAGQRYHERMWTAIATCKKQNRNFFVFLSDSITAKLQGGKGPSLLQA